MNIITKLFISLENDSKEDFVLLNNVPFHKPVLYTIPYFKNIGLDISEFSSESIKQFQLWLYEQKVESLHNVVDKDTFILFDFLSLEIPNFLFESKSEDLFCYLLQQRTSNHISRLLSNIHFNLNNKKNKNKKMNKKILNVNPEYIVFYYNNIDNDTKSEMISLLSEIYMNNADYTYNYSFLLEKRNVKKELLLKNWEKNNHTLSLWYYSSLLMTENYDREKKTKEVKEIKEIKEIKEERNKIKELFWKNWIENKETHSLHNYAYMLYEDGEKNKAKELFLKNWEENNNVGSLHCYAVSEKNRNIIKKIWEEYKNIRVLEEYISMLKKGIGGYRDTELAKELEKLIN